MAIGMFMPLLSAMTGEWVNIFNMSMSDGQANDTGSWANYTLRQTISGSLLTRKGGYGVRVSFRAANNSQVQLRNAFIGVRAGASGWNFTAPPTQLFNVSTGQPNSVIPAGQSAVLEGNYSIPEDSTLVLSTYIISGNIRRRSGSGNNILPFYKTGDSASEISPTGYTAESTYLLGFHSIDILT